MTIESQPGAKKQSLAKNMLAGALAACIAESVTIPIDASKVRLQLQ